MAPPPVTSFMSARYTRLQTSRGRLCAHWVAVIAATLDRRTCVPDAFRGAAAQQLLLAVYLNTTAILPTALRSRLYQGLLWWVAEDEQHSVCQLILCKVASTLLSLGGWDGTAAWQAPGGPEPVPSSNGVQGNACLQFYSAIRDNTIEARNLDGLPECRAELDVDFAVRGSALVSSAFGMLHHKAAVQVLMARWREGPWARRIDDPVHCVLILTLECADCGGGHCSAAALQDPRAASVYAHAPTEPRVTTSDDEEGKRELEATITSLKPLVRGGRRVVRVSPRLCQEYASIYEEYAALKDASESSQANEMARRRTLAITYLLAAGGALREAGKAVQAMAAHEQPAQLLLPMTHILGGLQLETSRL